MIAYRLAVIVFIGCLPVSAMFRVALPACNRWAKLRCSPDDAIKTFTTLSKTDMGIATNYLKRELEENEALLGEKDKRLEEKDQQLKESNEKAEALLEEKEQRLEDKDKLIKTINAMYLQAKGLMTSRGTFEFFLRQCSVELFGSATKRVNYTHVMERIEKKEQELPLTATKCRQLKTLMDECNVESLLQLYSSLSAKIHGDSWDGEAVRVYSQQLSKPHCCLITKIVDALGLESIIVDANNSESNSSEHV